MEKAILITQILVCIVLPYLLFRLWTFTIRPMLFPQDPKELPYLLPYLGHAIEFVKHGQDVITKARVYFGNTREPFALTLGGEKLYFLTSSQDVSSLYKNTTSFAFDQIVHQLTITFGVSKSAVDKTFASPLSMEDDTVARALGVPNPRLKSLASLNNDLWKQQMVPGAKYYELQNLFAHHLEKLMNSELAVLKEMGNKTLDKPLVSISLMAWSQKALIEAALRCFFGDVLIETEPQIIDDFLTFDNDNWKLWYKWPKAHAMYNAKARVAEALQRYVALPDSQRQGVSFIVDAFFKGQRALGTSDADLANMLTMVVFVTNTNTYKVAFWAVSYMLQNEKLIGHIRDETRKVFNPDGSIDQRELTNSCPWLSALFNESLRFCSASSSIRLVTETTYIGSKRLTKGSRVMVPFRQMHFDEQAYQHPHVFDPERFILDSKLSSGANFRPFGGGLSYCPGRFMAKQEVCMFVALLLQKFDVSTDGKQKFPELDAGKPTTGLMSPKDGEDLTLHLHPKRD